MFTLREKAIERARLTRFIMSVRSLASSSGVGGSGRLGAPAPIDDPINRRKITIVRKGESLRNSNYNPLPSLMAATPGSLGL